MTESWMRTILNGQKTPWPQDSDSINARLNEGTRREGAEASFANERRIANRQSGETRQRLFWLAVCGWHDTYHDRDDLKRSWVTGFDAARGFQQHREEPTP
jgi:hypothetical protein